MVYLSDIEDETYRTQVLKMLENHEKMWSGHVGELKLSRIA